MLNSRVKYKLIIYDFIQLWVKHLNLFLGFYEWHLVATSHLVMAVSIVVLSKQSGWKVPIGNFCIYSCEMEKRSLGSRIWVFYIYILTSFLQDHLFISTHNIKNVTLFNLKKLKVRKTYLWSCDFCLWLLRS